VRIAVIGGGPGGLYFAYLWKRRHPDAAIDLFEQNAAGATWGFGVVFSEQALEFLRADDPDTVDAITPRMQSWNNITLRLRGESVEIDGVGFSSIGRLDLLTILQQRAAAVGVTPRYDTPVASVDQLTGYDLIVAADGLNSLVRRSFEGDFGTSLSYSPNKFAWYGTTKRFETLSQTFVQTEFGSFNAHHYRYSASMSTFLVECDLAIWRLGRLTASPTRPSSNRRRFANRCLHRRSTAIRCCRTNRCGAISRGSGTNAGRSGIWC
jgi:2-polyprenyl-6-methoxyphenol hydroxylase-like FAD-dependent oxidoreductase